MTDSELDQLDRRAAVEVMGWVISKGKYYKPDNIDDIDYCEGHVDRPNYNSGFDHWQPTRNITQAWELLEKFDKKYRDVVWDNGRSKWACFISNPDNQLHEAQAETAPLAITLACLKAKDGE